MYFDLFCIWFIFRCRGAMLCVSRLASSCQSSFLSSSAYKDISWRYVNVVVFKGRLQVFFSLGCFRSKAFADMLGALRSFDATRYQLLLAAIHRQREFAAFYIMRACIATALHHGWDFQVMHLPGRILTLSFRRQLLIKLMS